MLDKHLAEGLWSRGKKRLSQPDRRFLFRLAAQVGRADVDAMAEEIDTQLFFDWMEFWKEEPFGMDWHRTGLAAYIALASSGGKPPADFVAKFLPSYDPAPPMTDDEIRQRLAMLRNKQ